jgi:glucose-1-phosphate adenylyltransferase
VGGKYRAIDFVLSNMVNSGIRDVGVLTQYSYRSLMDHLGSGKEWDLDRRYGGLFIFPPSLNRDDSGWYKGSADAMFNNLTYLERSSSEYVLIAQGNCVYKMNFDNLLEYHIKKSADITIAYRPMDDFLPDELTYLGIMQTDGDDRVYDLQEKPLSPVTKKGSMGIYVLKRELLISLLKECAAHGNDDFVKDILIKKVGSLDIYGYEFHGYWRNLSTLNMYFRCNMEFLNHEVREELFLRGGKVYTKVKDETPAKYNEEAEVTNSTVADGCIIEGSVENSILFRGVHVKRGAAVRNSIVMQGSVIEEGVSLEYTILDKNALITRNKRLKGEATLPFIVGKNVEV